MITKLIKIAQNNARQLPIHRALHSTVLLDGYARVPTPGVFEREGDCDKLSLDALFQFHDIPVDEATRKNIVELSNVRGQYLTTSSDTPQGEAYYQLGVKLFERLGLLALAASLHPNSVQRTLGKFGPFINYYWGHATLVVASSPSQVALLNPRPGDVEEYRKILERPKMTHAEVVNYIKETRGFTLKSVRPMAHFQQRVLTANVMQEDILGRRIYRDPRKAWPTWYAVMPSRLPRALKPLEKVKLAVIDTRDERL